MYGKLLQLTFDESRNEMIEAVISSNTRRLVATFDSGKLDLETISKSSDVIVLYDILDKKPLMLIERIPISKISLEECKDKISNSTVAMTYTASVNITDDKDYVDVIVVRRDAYEALSEDS